MPARSAITGGKVELVGVKADDMRATIAALIDAGVTVEEKGHSLHISSDGKLKPLTLSTAPFPGFATDMQAQFMAMLCKADGASVLTETIFENRYMHVPELARMGADIQVRGRTAVVRGVDHMVGAPVMATDLRASMSLIIAGLVAEGETQVSRVYHLDRGYERLEEKLQAVGADIERVGRRLIRRGAQHHAQRPPGALGVRARLRRGDGRRAHAHPDVPDGPDDALPPRRNGDGLGHGARHGADHRRGRRSPPMACSRATSPRSAPIAGTIEISAPEDAALGGAHWRLMLVLVIALIIDVMKPASLGFTIPGMVSEYAVPKATASLVPFAALIGTVTGSVLWGVIADIYGRKASILLSAVMFVGTSICGAMPSLAWNIGMCFMMGAAAGGMLPVTYALLAEMMPNKHRGWSLVLVGGLGAVGGYFAASGFSALLQPIFGWRILWLLNLPTGLIAGVARRVHSRSPPSSCSRAAAMPKRATVMARFGATAKRRRRAAAAPRRDGRATR